MFVGFQSRASGRQQAVSHAIGNAQIEQARVKGASGAYVASVRVRVQSPAVAEPPTAGFCFCINCAASWSGRARAPETSAASAQPAAHLLGSRLLRVGPEAPLSSIRVQARGAPCASLPSPPARPSERIPARTRNIARRSTTSRTSYRKAGRRSELNRTLQVLRPSVAFQIKSGIFSVILSARYRYACAGILLQANRSRMRRMREATAEIKGGAA
jgi:hypothetical protein